MIVRIIASLFFLFVLYSCLEDSKVTKKHKNQSRTKTINFVSNARGCTSFRVYKFNKTYDTAIVINGKRKKLKLSKKWQNFKLSQTNSNILNVKIKTFNRSVDTTKQHDVHFCNDVMLIRGLKVTNKWKALKGTVKLRISKDSLRLNPVGNPYYKMDLQLKNIMINNHYINNLEFKNVKVGEIFG